MKRTLVLLIAMLAPSLNAQTIDPPYEAEIWFGGKAATITYTFDDNDLNQLAVAVPLFNEFDYKLTLFTLTGTGTGWRDPNWPGLQAAAAQGHEIASHTVTHPYFNQITLEEQQIELEESYNAIAAHIATQTWQTLAYPYCVTGNDSLVSQYYIGARGCSGSFVRSSPSSTLNLSSIICGTEGSVKTAANFNSSADNAAGRNRWCVFLMHGIDDDGGWSPVESTELRSHLEYIDANSDLFWVATFGDGVRYIRERDAVSVSEISVGDSVITVQVTDSLDNAIYDHPVTIRRPLPDGWPSATAAQNGESVTSRIIEVEEVRYVLFDAVPDGGDVELMRSENTGVQTGTGRSLKSATLSQNYPNPFNPSTQIHFQLGHPGRVAVTILNTLGQELIRLADRQFDAGSHTLHWDGRDQSGNPVTSGVYFYSLSSEQFSEIRRMLLIR